MTLHVHNTCEAVAREKRWYWLPALWTCWEPRWSWIIGFNWLFFEVWWVVKEHDA